MLELGWAALGTRLFWLATASTWAIATLGAVGLGYIWPSGGPISGTSWWFGAILVFWGLKNRGRRLRLFFAIELRAETAIAIFGAIDLLLLIVHRNLDTAHALLAFLAAFSVLLFDEDMWRRWRLQRRRKDIERQLSKFTVIEGGKSGERPRRSRPDDTVN